MWLIKKTTFEGDKNRYLSQFLPLSCFCWVCFWVAGRSWQLYIYIFWRLKISNHLSSTTLGHQVRLFWNFTILLIKRLFCKHYIYYLTLGIQINLTLIGILWQCDNEIDANFPQQQPRLSTRKYIFYFSQLDSRGRAVKSEALLHK